MAKATWNGVVLAEAAKTKVMEGNLYFPPESVNQEYLTRSAATSICGWKGTAHYYDVVVDGKVNEQAAWYYPTPKSEAAEIAGHVAFWNGVEVDSAEGSDEDLGEGKSCSV